MLNRQAGEPGGAESGVGRRALLVEEISLVYLIALRVLRSPELAEETVQEVYAKVRQGGPRRLDPPARRTYLAKMARHTALDLIRARRRRQRLVPPAVGGGASVSPECQAEQQEALRAVRGALEALPREEREAVSLCCEAGLTEREAAEVLAIPHQTLHHRVQRGLERLRRSLAAQGFLSATASLILEHLQALGQVPLPAALHARLAQAGELGAAGGAHAGPAGGGSGGGVGLGRSGWMLAGGVFLALAGGLYLATALGGQGTRLVEAPGAPPGAAVVEPPAPLSLRWSFRDGPAADLTQISGPAWHWEAPSGGLPGRMTGEANQPYFILLPPPIGHRVIEVAVWYTLSGSRRMRWQVGARWEVDGRLQPSTDWVRLWKNSPQGLFTARLYFIEAQHLSHMQCQGQEWVPVVSRFERLEAGRRVALYFRNVSVQEITLRSVELGAIPAALREPEAWTRKPEYGLESFPR